MRELGATQSRMSRHMVALKAAGLVVDRRDAQSRADWQRVAAPAATVAAVWLYCRAPSQWQRPRTGATSRLVSQYLAEIVENGLANLDLRRPDARRRPARHRANRHAHYGCEAFGGDVGLAADLQRAGVAAEG